MARRRKGNPVHGWVVIDKPTAVSSSKVVGRVKRLYSAQKAGHGGTLDPFATGLLPIALGEATKTMSFVMDGEKGYRFTVKWGVATDTEDCDGEIIQSCDRIPAESEIKALLSSFLGEQEQRPPIYSALKVDGKRAYQLARQGDVPELALRRITVESLDLVDVRENEADFEVHCSKGTYVRSLGRDIAEKLGTFGHLTSLRRIKCGKFAESDAISLEILEELGHSARAFEHLKPLMTVLDDISALALSAQEAARLRHGQPLSISEHPDLLELEGKDLPVLAREEREGDPLPIALGRIEDGMFKPGRVFNL